MRREDSLTNEPHSLVEGLLQIYPEPLRARVRAGLEDLRVSAVALGFEVLRAERSGLSYADAARTPGFTLMAQVHFGTIDLLQYELPREFRELVPEIVRRAQGLPVAEVDRLVFTIAGASNVAVESALMRFLLYQALRLGVWVMTWPVREAAELEATGVLLEIDIEAESRLRNRLGMSAMHHSDVRPQVVLLGELFELLGESLRRHRNLIAKEGGPFLEYMHGMIHATRIARRLDAADAVLLRNEIDAAMQRDALQLLPLVERHALALPSVDAAKQRRRRLHKKLTDGDLNPARPRLIDLLHDVAAME